MVQEGGTVHGTVVTSENGRFLVTKVFQTAVNWPSFDSEEHVKGTVLLWKLDDVQKIADSSLNDVSISYPTYADHPTPTRGRKRKRDPARWVRTIRKKARAEGKEYEYISRDKQEKKRVQCNIKDSCGNCQKNCSLQFSEEDRSQVFSQYWQLQTIDEKRLFLTKLIQSVPSKRTRKRRVCKGARRNHCNNFKYYFKKDDNLIEVCQTFFLNTLDISRKQVRTAMEKVTEVGTIESDKRGKTINHKLSDELINEIVEHVCMFKTVESHYVRRNSQFQYLPSTLDVASMHRMYVTWCTENNYKPATYNTYRTIFKEKFNMKFHQPKKDRCDFCDAWENAVGERKEEMKKKKSMIMRKI